MKRSIVILAMVMAAVLLIVHATPAHAQTAPNLSQQLNLGMLSLMPEPLLDPTTNPPGKFSNVIPGQFDPGKTYLVQSSWLSGLGCVTSGFIATPNATFTGVGGTAPYVDSACPTGDPSDSHNEGLLLAKTGPTNNFASATAELVNVKGMTLTELGYDIRKAGGSTLSPQGSHCGAGAPRFDVVTSDGNVHFVGCTSPPPLEGPASNDYIRLRWGAAQLAAAFPPITATDVVNRIVIIFDEGTDTGPDFFGAAILDNIDVNGQLVGRGPTNGK